MLCKCFIFFFLLAEVIVVQKLNKAAWRKEAVILPAVEDCWRILNLSGTALAMTTLYFHPQIRYMQHHDFLDIVPEHYTGTDIEVKASAEFDELSEAVDFFTVAKQRLLNVNQWHAVAGIVSASFQAVDTDGNEVHRSITKGDHMRVDIPGPGSSAGDGYDWVMIEEVKEINNDDVQSTGFRVRPIPNPSGDTKDVAHFYDPSSTSNFIVTRQGKKVTASIIDRNIKPNTGTNSITDKVRGTAVGLSAIAFFSKLQWQNLADGIVKKEK